METRLTKYQDVEDAVIIDQPEEKKAFILGNTRGIELQNLQDDYLVPVFSRDNVETISHHDFINTVFDAAQTFYQGQQFLEPNIRAVSYTHLDVYKRQTGNSGRSTGPHLHLTLKKDGKNINPAILLNLIKQTSMSNMFAENTANPEN